MKTYEMIEKFLTKKDSKLTAEETALLKQNYWLKALWLKSNIDDINIERFDTIDSINPHATLEYVYRTLKVLEAEAPNLNSLEYTILNDVLCYSEVAKGGTPQMRKKWQQNHFSIAIHNFGSADIYRSLNQDRFKPNYLRYVSTLIATHGMIGQYLRGETSLKSSEPLIGLSFPDVDHEKVVKILNKCIIKGVSEELYESLEAEINTTIETLLIRNYNRLKKLRAAAIRNGENFDKEYHEFIETYPECIASLNCFLNRYDFWYIEAATNDFKLDTTLKLFVYIQRAIGNKPITDISFKNMMSFYCDYHGKKVINVFKERVIEKLLTEYDISSDAPLKNNFVELVFDYSDDSIDYNILNLKWQFTPISEKFIDFCIAAIGQGALYDKVITMACDHFGIRRDKYDRFYNEYEYLQTMNSTTHLKKILVDYVTGDTIVDVGPGGGGLMDAILERFPSKKVMGIDVSENVIEKLQKVKTLYSKKWDVLQGNALELEKTFKEGEFDTIIFCSILHELYSYIPYDGKNFNYDTLRTVFCSVYHLLPKGGRLIIRDGIMTESNEDRKIRFKNPADMEILKRYANDFKGRKITFEAICEDTVQMPINDAMEFLYTYTWGEESYAHEINEQFGYFTPKQYIDFVTECFEGNCKVIDSKHFLQSGYSEHLLEKIEFLDAKTNVSVNLPDSTFILVIEKN
ncbi:MAG: class I SAM-dependent methyltransferase [Clostridia bacterium]|nr:class I SAM-dependent methyltransferase [Clostridia bacterium]